MSPKQWLSLLCFYTSYLFFGASVFYHMEHRLETERREVALQSRIEIHELLTAYTAPKDHEIQKVIIDKISDYCEKPLTNYTEDKYVNPYVWNFYHSFFFSFTVCSTVGYGNISPNNDPGRIFMIFYALIGIPVNGILFAYLGEFFGKIFVRVYKRYKQYKISTNSDYSPKKLGLIAQIALYLIPGILIFIFLPACLFTIFEDWPYTISVYYAFVTLTTIGFGDYVVSFQPHQEREFGPFFIMYQIFIIVWFIFGVGYLVMIMGFLGRGLRSKKIAYLEHQLALNIKQTQTKIWHGVTKDIGYLRRILNEIYMMKFKPVYNEPNDMRTDTLPRSESCPDLLMYRSTSPIPQRKRAFSESFGSEMDQEPCSLSCLTLNRAQSDTDLNKIDKKRTFEGVNAVVQPGELLARVVTALGSLRPKDEDGQSVLELAVNKGSGGIHGFTDEEILASESGWSLPTSEKSFNMPPLKPRDRACSEVRIPQHHQFEDAHEWTWSGSNTQIKELMRLRQRGQKNDLYRASFGTEKLDRPFAINIPQELPPAATNKTLLSRFNPFKKRTFSVSESKRDSLSNETYSPNNYLEATANGRSSRISLPKQYLNSTQKGRQSVYSLTPQPEETSLLETTTIADLIRAIELVHTNRLDGSECGSIPRRKMGTASLTPPKVPSLLTLFPSNYDSINPSSFEKRRTSLRPSIYNSARFASNKGRRQSSAVIGNLNNSASSSGMNMRYDLSQQQIPPPPPYSDSPPPTMKRRFSVRPTNLLTPPGQTKSSSGIPTSSSSATATSALQRKLSIRPSPLARQLNINNEPSTLWRPRPAQLQRSILTSRTRHGSLSNLYEKRLIQLERQRNDSK